MEVLTSIALSLHLGFAGDYNAIHPHVRLQQQQYITGVYYNSEYTISPYVGYRFEHNDIGLELGAVGGYSHADVLPYVRATYKDFFVTPIPVGPDTGIVFGYELKF